MFQDKYNVGKKLRSKFPRSKIGFWKPDKKRPSALDMIKKSNYDRLPELVPVRHFRMKASPFAFYRGTASLMARDLAKTTSSGIVVQVCGDCHLMNFGGFGTPERHIIMDVNDFDETLPGQWEWDLKRLAVSFELAFRDKGFVSRDATDVVIKLVNAYRDSMLEFSRMNFLDLWYMKFDLEVMAKNARSAEVRQRLLTALEKVNKQTHDTVFYKMTSDILGKYAITEQLPLIIRPANMEQALGVAKDFVSQYKRTLQPDRRFLLDQYKLYDIALKVVGVGSVGTRCFVALLLNDQQEPLFLQIKEARQSVLEAYNKRSIYKHDGERIVQGQRLIQSASDIFLGWASGPTGRAFYLRQLRDKKMSPIIETMGKTLLEDYAGATGRILAKAHCKSSKGAEISGYIGRGEVFANAIAKFAKAYADQTERDFADFVKAIKAGKLHAEEKPANSLNVFRTIGKEVPKKK